MTQQRGSNAVLNFATSLGFTAVTLLGAMVSSRLIEHWIGEDRFGEYRALVEWFGYLALLELGLGGAISPLLSRALSAGDRPALRGVLAAGTRAYLGVMGLAIAIGLGLVVALPWLIPVPPSVRPDLWLVRLVSRLLVGPIAALLDRPDLRLAGLITLIGFTTLPMIPLRSLTEADQKGYRLNLLLIGQFVLITATALLLCGLRPEWGISGQAAAVALGALAMNGVLLLTTLPRLPGTPIEIARTRPDAAVWRGIWGLSWPTLILQFAGRINLQTDSIILSQMVGVSAVTSLYFTQRLAQMAQMQLANIGTASWAGLADLFHRGEHETFRRRLLELFRLVTILGIATIGPIVAYNRHFVAFWMGPKWVDELYGGDLVAVSAGLNALLIPLISLCGWCMTGTGRVRMLVVPSLISSTINLSTSILLARYVGVAGPLLGTTVTILTFSIWVNSGLIRRTFGVPMRSMARSVAVPMAWGLPYTGGLWWLSTSQRHVGWLGLAAQMGLASTGFLGLAAAILLTPDERAAWRGRLGAGLGRLKAIIPGRSREPAHDVGGPA